MIIFSAVRLPLGSTFLLVKRSLFLLFLASKEPNRHSFKNSSKESDHFWPKIIYSLFQKLNLFHPSLAAYSSCRTLSWLECFQSYESSYSPQFAACYLTSGILKGFIVSLLILKLKSLYQNLLIFHQVFIIFHSLPNIIR